MKHLLIGAALLAASSATAQMNRVSLNFHTISGGKNFSESPGKAQRSDGRSLNLLPTIGFHRLVGKSTGIGLELGYNHNKSVYEQRQPSGVDLSSYTVQEVKSEEFFISPGIFEVITSPNKRYRLIPYLNLPIGYTPKATNVSKTTISRESNGDVFSGMYSETAPREQLRIGLQAGASAQIRIAGGLYAGISLGAGVTYYRQKVTGEQVSIYTPPGGVPSRTSVTVPENHSQTFGFGIQPQINLNYFF